MSRSHADTLRRLVERGLLEPETFALTELGRTMPIDELLETLKRPKSATAPVRWRYPANDALRVRT